MPITDDVVINVTADSVGVALPGFGIPLILSATAAWAERVRFYTSLAGVIEDFPATSGPEYLAAQALFSQRPKPQTIAIGRSALKPTQVYSVSLVDKVVGATYGISVVGDGVTATECEYTALADLTFVTTHGSELCTSAAHGMSTGDGPYRLTNSGGGLPAGFAVDTDYWIIRLTADTFQLATSYADAIALTPAPITTDGTGTHTLERDANDVIVSQLVDQLNSVVGKNYTAARVDGAGDTDTFTVTASAAGEWFSLEPSSVSRMLVNQTHIDPGVATDLAAIQVENDSWYMLITVYNSDAYVKAAAAWIETQAKIYGFDTNESTAITTAAGNGDLLDDLHGLAYDRTFGSYHPNPSNMITCRWAGRVLPTEPGAATWKFKQLTGAESVTFTATQRTNLKNRKGNAYQSGATWEGWMVSGEWIDVTRNLDWQSIDMATAIYNALLNNDVVPYSNDGIALIDNEMIGSLARGVARGIWVNDPAPVTVVPKAADVSDADKAARTLTGCSWSATLAGAVHAVNPINGVVSL